MGNQNDRDAENHEEVAGADLSGPYARDSGAGGDDYAREDGFSGAGGRNDYARETIEAIPADDPKNSKANE
jgi:hypothetical protein